MEISKDKWSDNKSRMRKRQSKKNFSDHNFNQWVKKECQRRPPSVPGMKISEESASKYKLNDISFGYKKKAKKDSFEEKDKKKHRKGKKKKIGR